MSRMIFVVEGHARTKKTSSRIIHVGGKPRIIPSKVTVDWSNDAQLQLQAQLGKYRGNAQHAGTFYNLRAVFYRKQNTTADLSGHLQALCDVLQAAEVVTNDRQIRGFDGSRLRLSPAHPRVELELTEMEGEL